ncbi:MAG: adenosylcobinamide-GDP ribazoletransferase [Chloroflexota bacterium]
MKLFSTLNAAFGFLTIVPVPALGNASMGWAVACFPLVGATLGGMLAGLDRLLMPWLPTNVAAALLLATLLAATGALHLDGFMDSFDGLFGGRTPERRLEIMRDSRVGSYGIAAAGAMLLLEYNCLISLPPSERVRGLVLATTLSRWAMAIVLWGFPAANPKGLAAWLKPEIHLTHAAVATLFTSVIAGVCFGWMGVVFLAAAGAAAFLGGRFATGKLGGVTGDICGGAGQLVEVATLLAVIAFTIG